MWPCHYYVSGNFVKSLSTLKLPISLCEKFRTQSYSSNKPTLYFDGISERCEDQISRMLWIAASVFWGGKIYEGCDGAGYTEGMTITSGQFVTEMIFLRLLPRQRPRLVALPWRNWSGGVVQGIFQVGIVWGLSSNATWRHNAKFIVTFGLQTNLKVLYTYSSVCNRLDQTPAQLTHWMRCERMKLIAQFKIPASPIEQREFAKHSLPSYTCS